jgi:iron-sulfur cluster insertion protein
MDQITFAQSAIDKIKEILAEEGDPTVKLRVFVQGGGCSGFQYGFTLDNIQAEDDTVIEFDGISALVDMMSLQYLTGATVQYIDDLTGSQFRISNPNAVSTCGCGSSFSI